MKKITALVCLFATLLFAAPSSASEKVDYPERTLRGYGRVSASFVREEQRSILKIDCEDESKAKLVLAKYLGDLSLFGGVRELRENNRSVFEIEHQGRVTAFRNENSVFIVAGKSGTDLFRGFVGKRITPKTAFKPETEVPMFLDAWDRFAFRYYYRAWEKPPTVKEWNDYDPVKTEFDHAAAFGRLGFIFWAKPNIVDTARGLTNETEWDWAFRTAEKRNLPVVVNTSLDSSTPWTSNRYPEQTQQLMPDYLGSFHSVGEPFFGGTGTLSWCATTARDAELGVLAGIVRDYRKDNVIDYLEPHGELKHGDYDIFLEYGPLADANYRTFLQEKYGSIAELSTRWHGKADALKDWDDVRVPQLASFVGWDEQAIELKGDWRVGYEPDRPADAPRPNAGNVAGSLAPEEWFAAMFDDSAWPTLRTPGDEMAKFTKRAPAVFRFQVDIPPDWINRHEKVWLYVWDLNQAYWHSVQAWVNGTKIGDEPVRHPNNHWFAPEATEALKPGKNTVALRLPQAFLGYKVYFSPHPPLQYPALGREKNAQWVDFADWRRRTRIETCRRGLEMIRQNDQERGIVLMAPDSYTSDMKVLAEDYGGRFHNTGYMAATWAEPLPMLMRGGDLPFSLEPGGPAGNIAEFKRMLGYYLTEGVNAIHYFIHAGCILWDDAMKKHLEDNRENLFAMGRMHVPKAEAAFLLSDRVRNLTDFPWGMDLNTNLPSGYWTWRVNERLLPFYPMDAVGDHDFARGSASAYKLILDTNTSIMSKDMLAEIEAWVRAGGVFVAYVQTGRHSPEEPDSWPISALTGYEILHVDPLQENGDPVASRKIDFVKGQDVFQEDRWRDHDKRAHGLSLKKSQPDCRDLLLWEDGSVAAGVRPLGKGFVVHLGLRHLGKNAWQGNTDGNCTMLRDLFAWRNLKPQPGRVDGAFLRHNVSNNGLFDLWAIWNNRDEERKNVALELDHAVPVLKDVKDGKERPVSVENGKTHYRIDMQPQDTVLLMTPRGEILDAPRRWFELQRNWWRGGTESVANPKEAGEVKEAGESGKSKEAEAVPVGRWTQNLSEGWKVRFLPEVKPEDAEANPDYATQTFDDSAWGDGRIDVWTVPEEQATRRCVLRRRFTVSQEDGNGEIDLYVKSTFGRTVRGRMRAWLDGEEILKADNNSHNGIYRRVSEELESGKEHLLVLEIFGEGPVPGILGNVWLAFIPKPVRSIDLSGPWSLSKDALQWREPVTLPGRWEDALLGRRTITIDKEMEGKTACFRLQSGWATNGVIVNGHYLRRHHHLVGRFTHLNITPYLKYGQENEIVIVCNMTPNTEDVFEIGLDFYDPATVYP